MIRTFAETDTDFTSNGDWVLSPLKAKIHKSDNGDYYLDLETGLEYVNLLTEGRIIVANTPTGDQAFRINNVQKTKNKVSARCWHVFYDSENYVIADSYVVNKDCADALSHLNSATFPESEFTTDSDIETVNSFRCVRKSLYEAVNTVLERWGGHLVRDNFSISIMESIGQDNGIVVQFGKNLKDISVSEDWSEVVTDILPVGKDGVLLTDDPDAGYDEIINVGFSYEIPYTKVISFNQDINEDDYPTHEEYISALVNDLYYQANVYGMDHFLPKINYTLNANLEKVTDIGDRIKVIDDRLGVDILTQVIAFDYDCISEKFTSVEFGNLTKTIEGIGNTLSQTAQKQNSGIIANKQLIFNTDGTVSWQDYD